MLNGRWFIARRKIKSPIVLTLLCPEDRVGKIWPYSQLIVSRTCALSIFFHEYLLKYVNLKYEVINKVSSINMKLTSSLIYSACRLSEIKIGEEHMDETVPFLFSYFPVLIDNISCRFLF